MKLGEMLIRDGHVSADQVEVAIAKQSRDGGRVGTVLVEMEAIDLDTLTVYLGLELGIPIATIATLSKAKRMAVRLLTPELAAKLRCIPLLIQDRQLIAAVDDPHDMERLDELARLTGYRIIPRVAPEIRIFYYLERYYGVPRPERFRALEDNPHRNADLPAPPLPGLPPIQTNPVAAPTPRPILRPAPQHEAQEALHVDASDLLGEMQADRAETAPLQQVQQLDQKPAEQPEPTPRTSKRESFPPLSAEAAIQRIERAQQRSEIASALMSYAAKRFDVAAILIVRDNMAFGWKGFGPELDYDRIEALLVPLEVPSILQRAVQDNRVFSGNVFPSTLHNYLFRVLRSAPPENATVAAVAIGKRIVNLIYGHRHDHRKLNRREVEEFQQVCTAAVEAYVRLIAISKQDQDTNEAAGTATVPPEPALS